jgi:Arc/MetJ-type ribon-helix-helix transcriptional regulator
MNQTINISLPVELKKQAQELVDAGLYASFSDLIRSSLRKLIPESKYDLMAKKAIKEYESGKATILDSEEDIDKFIHNLVK